MKGHPSFFRASHVFVSAEAFTELRAALLIIRIIVKCTTKDPPPFFAAVRPIRAGEAAAATRPTNPEEELELEDAAVAAVEGAAKVPFRESDGGDTRARTPEGPEVAPLSSFFVAATPGTTPKRTSLSVALSLCIFRDRSKQNMATIAALAFIIFPHQL